MKALFFTVLLTLSGPASAKLYEVFTDLGTIYLSTNESLAPVTSENFDRYVSEEFYNHTIFHRVVEGFVIQGGGYTTTLDKKETHDAIANESDNGLKNVYGSIAMARFSDPDSATSQFYINLRDNPHLDASEQQKGYTVFGRVNCGMPVTEQIAAEAVRNFETFTHLPEIAIRIVWIKEIEADNHGYSECQRQQNSANS